MQANAGRMVKRFGEHGLAIGGGVKLALAFLAVAFTPLLAGAAVASALCGFSFYMLHNTLQTSATQMAPEARGAAVSLFASSLFIGQIVGVAVAGPVFDRWGGGSALVVAALLTPLLAGLCPALSAVLAEIAKPGFCHATGKLSALKIFASPDTPVRHEGARLMVRE